MNRKKYIIGAFCAFFGFFTFGFLDNIKGAVLPNLLADLNLNYSQGSDGIMLNLLGYVIGTLVPSLLAKIIRKNKLVIYSASFMIIGTTSLTLFNKFLLIKASLFLLGIGLGIMQVAGNSLIISSFPQSTGKYLNILTFFNGIGSSLAPLYVSLLLYLNFNWREIYKLSLLLPIILFILAVIKVVSFDKNAEQTNLDYVQSGIREVKIDFFILAAILFLYIAAEIGFASWIPEFLNKTKNFSNSRSNFYLSVFFILLTLGRLLGSFIVEKMPYIKLLLITTSLAVVFLCMGVFLPPAFAIFLSLTGLCFSVIFPTTVAVASERYRNIDERILSILFFSGGMGGVLGPWIMGKVAYFSNLTAALAMPALFCIFIIGALLLFSFYNNCSKTDF